MTRSGYLCMWCAAAVFAVATAVFAVNGRNAFVRIDDLDYIAKNPFIKDGLTERSIVWAAGAVGYADNWHPLTWMSHAVDVSVARLLGIGYAEQPNPAGMWARVESPFARFVHMENVVWHAANATLLYLVILALTGANEGLRFHRNRPVGDMVLAAACALLWAVHPLRVEVVAWASERKELLSVFFMLTSLLAYLRQGASNLSLVCYALALLSKPVAVGFPAVLVGVDLLRGGFRWRELAERTWIFALMAVGACALTMGAQGSPLSQGAAFSLKTRVGAALEAPAVYIAQTLWPAGLSFDYAMPTRADWPWIAAGGLVQLLVPFLGLCWLRSAFRGKPQSFGWRLVPLAVGWCYVCLVPMLGIVKVGYQPHSDRYTYWVGCGAATVIALVLAKTQAAWRPFRRQLLVAAAVAVVALGGLSIERSKVWRDNAALMSDMVGNAHNPFFARLLASELNARGQVATAERMLRETAEVNPCAYSYGALAWQLSRHGAADEAARWADRALAADAECVFAHAAKGMIEKAAGNRVEAIRLLKKAYEAMDDFELKDALDECRGTGEGGR